MFNSDIFGVLWSKMRKESKNWRFKDQTWTKSIDEENGQIQHVLQKASQLDISFKLYHDPAGDAIIIHLDIIPTEHVS